MSKFVYIWKYKVKPEFRWEFEKAYNTNGDWANLFRQSPGYIKTELLKDRNNPNQYITIDYWKSFDDNQNFKKQFVSNFQLLDEKCDAYTDEETYIGDLNLLNSSNHE
jgi:heme-degrading monooxygenase HmoA